MAYRQAYYQLIDGNKSRKSRGVNRDNGYIGSSETGEEVVAEPQYDVDFSPWL